MTSGGGLPERSGAITVTPEARKLSSDHRGTRGRALERGERRWPRFVSVSGALGLVAPFVYVLPYLVGGTSTPVRGHDNLDSIWLSHTMRARAGSLWEWGGSVPDLLGGVPAGATGSDLFVPSLLVNAFGSFTAYVINQFALRVVAYFGMRRLLKGTGLAGGAVSTAVAVLFAWLPFWAPGGLAIAGLPLLASSYLQVRAGRQRWFDWCVVGLIPFYSSVVHIGALAAVVMAIDATRARLTGHAGPARRVRNAVLLFTAGSVVAEGEVWIAALTAGWTSHRVEFDLPGLQLRDLPGDVISGLLEETTHSAAVAVPIILLTALVGVALAMIGSSRSPSLRHHPVIITAVLAIAVQAAASASRLEAFGVITKPLGVLGTMALRFEWLLPLTLYALFGAVLTEIARRFGRTGTIAVATLVMLQGMLLLESAESRNPNNLSYRAYLAEPMFRSLRRDLCPSTVVAAIGFHPGVLSFSGIRTIDGYLSSYPLEKKTRFRPVISAELARDPELRRYFDDWGSRLYLFSAELGLGTFDRPDRGKPIAPRIDTAALRRLGVEFIVSSVDLLNVEELGLSFQGIYSHRDVPWFVRLYGLTEAPPTCA